MEILALSFALLAGVRPWQILILALVVFAPIVLVVPLIYIASFGRKPKHDRMALLCDVVAAELRSGATLRSALLEASNSVSIAIDPVKSSQIGAEEIAAMAAREMPRLGRELVASVDAVARSGSSAADVFDELAAHAISHDDVLHEVRVASAPARATAWFFALATLVLVVLQATRGSLTELLAEPAQRMTASGGALLFAVGLTWVMLLIRRAG